MGVRADKFRQITVNVRIIWEAIIASNLISWPTEFARENKMALLQWKWRPFNLIQIPVQSKRGPVEGWFQGSWCNLNFAIEGWPVEEAISVYGI